MGESHVLLVDWWAGGIIRHTKIHIGFVLLLLQKNCLADNWSKILWRFILDTKWLGKIATLFSSNQNGTYVSAFIIVFVLYLAEICQWKRSNFLFSQIWIRPKQNFPRTAQYQYKYIKKWTSHTKTGEGKVLDTINLRLFVN